jgi:nitrate/nitrite transporter NarK
LTEKAGPPPLSLAWLVWGLGATLYLIAFFQRVAPAVITRELSLEFGLSAAALGNLSAFYFYSYVAVQIPTGLAADRWGPRRLLATGAALTALGTLFFALAPSLAWASAGRLFIGAAVGVAFVSMLKLVTHWMPARLFAFASGVALVVGVVGATLAGAPLRMGVDAFGWRPVMVVAAIVTALASIAIWLVVRDDPAERGYASYFPVSAHRDAPSVAAQLREVLSYRNTWLLLLIPGSLSGIILSFAGLWGIPFLETQYGFTTREAAMLASGMLITWSLSTLAWAPLSQRIGRRKPIFAGGLAAAMALWSVVVLVPQLPRAALVVLLAAVAISAGVFVLTFAFAKESVPARLGGTASGIANMGVMLGGLFMQPLVGFVLDSQWKGALAGGVRAYDFAAYRSAFTLMLVWCVASLAMLAFTRESGCRQAP